MRSADKKAPPPGPVVTAGEHRVHRNRLANGLPLIVIEQPHLHTAAAALLVKVGSRHEDESTGGLSHLLEHMVFRGTERHPSAHDFNLAVEQLGGAAWGATHADYTLFGLSLPPESLGEGMAVFGDLFVSPRFADLQTEKRIIREEILQSLDESGRNVDVEDLSRKLLFANHPLGYTIAGGLDNLERFTVGDLTAHMERFYVTGNMVLCVAGAVQVDRVLDAAGKSFARLRSGEPARTTPPSGAFGGPRFRYVHSPGSQTDVRICFPTFGESDPRRMALVLLTRVLDDGMSTRLSRRICDELGLAYEVFAVLELYDDCGVFGVGATAEHAKVPALLRETLALLKDLTLQPVTDSEMVKAGRRYQWSLRASLDSAEAMCSHYGTAALFGLPSHLPKLAESAAAVTAAELQQVARQLIRPGLLHTACVGMLDGRLGRQARDIVEKFV